MIQLKKCSKCEEVKSINLFYKLKTSKDGYRPDCKDCGRKLKNKFAKDNPIRNRCNLMATGIMQRTVYEIDKPRNKCYKDNNVKSEVGENAKDISNYLYANHYNEIESLINVGKIPSVDRINSSKNYSPDNIRIVDAYENVVDGCMNAIKVTSKSIKAIYLDGKEIIFPSISEASRNLNMKRDTIYAHLNKNTVCRKGYKFEYVN